MKKYLFLIFVVIISSCSKEPDTGTLHVTLSYFYNQYQGYRPDVDARVYLFRPVNGYYGFEGTYLDWRTGSPKISGTDETVQYAFRGTADVSGKVTLQNIPYGKYQVLAVSKGRFVFSRHNIELNQPELSISKNFNTSGEFDEMGQMW